MAEARIDVVKIGVRPHLKMKRIVKPVLERPFERKFCRVQVKPSAREGLIAAFSLIAISEMGDKTQIATLLLSVKYQSFLSVFLGSLVALSFASFLGILVAGRLHRFIPAKYITPISGVLFILLGAGTIISLFYGPIK